jgi:hypothetical protein
VTVLAAAGGEFLEEQDEAETASVAGRRENNTRLTIRRSRVDDSRSAVLNLSALKKEKLLPTPPCSGSSRSRFEGAPARLALSRGEQLARKGFGQVS